MNLRLIKLITQEGGGVKWFFKKSFPPTLNLSKLKNNNQRDKS